MELKREASAEAQNLKGLPSGRGETGVQHALRRQNWAQITRKSQGDNFPVTG